MIKEIELVEGKSQTTEEKLEVIRNKINELIKEQNKNGI